jgi:hypothetical protein
VVGVVEDDHRRAAGGVSGHFDGVFDGFGSGVEQCRALVMLAGSDSGQFLADREVRLVGGDHEAGVGELLNLRLNGCDHCGCGVAHTGHRDTGTQIDQRVAIDVEQHPTSGGCDEHRHRDTHPGRDRRVAPRRQFPRPRTGQLSHQTTPLNKPHTGGHRGHRATDAAPGSRQRGAGEPPRCGSGRLGRSRRSGRCAQDSIGEISPGWRGRRWSIVIASLLSPNDLKHIVGLTSTGSWRGLSPVGALPRARTLPECAGSHRRDRTVDTSSLTLPQVINS